jgi:hypothetical protein
MTRILRFLCGYSMWINGFCIDGFILARSAHTLEFRRTCAYMRMIYTYIHTYIHTGAEKVHKLQDARNREFLSLLVRLWRRRVKGLVRARECDGRLVASMVERTDLALLEIQV